MTPACLATRLEIPDCPERGEMVTWISAHLSPLAWLYCGMGVLRGKRALITLLITAKAIMTWKNKDSEVRLTGLQTLKCVYLQRAHILVLSHTGHLQGLNQSGWVQCPAQWKVYKMGSTNTGFLPCAAGVVCTSLGRKPSCSTHVHELKQLPPWSPCVQKSLQWATQTDNPAKASFGVFKDSRILMGHKKRFLTEWQQGIEHRNCKEYVHWNKNSRRHS